MSVTGVDSEKKVKLHRSSDFLLELSDKKDLFLRYVNI